MVTSLEGPCLYLLVLQLIPLRGDGELWKVRVLRAPPQLRAFCSEMRVSAVEPDRFTVTLIKQPLSLTLCLIRFRSRPHRPTVSGSGADAGLRVGRAARRAVSRVRHLACLSLMCGVALALCSV